MCGEFKREGKKLIAVNQSTCGDCYLGPNSSNSSKDAYSLILALLHCLEHTHNCTTLNNEICFNSHKAQNVK